jgi:hypothetical protein
MIEGRTFMPRLTNPENALLREILQREHDSLMVEINHTDSLEYKQGLRDRQHLLESIQNKVGMPEEVQVS